MTELFIRVVYIQLSFSTAAALMFLHCHCKDILENTSLVSFCTHLHANRPLPVSLSLSFPRRFKIPESFKINTVLRNLTVFEYLENKVRIKLHSFTQPPTMTSSLLLPPP